MTLGSRLPLERKLGLLTAGARYDASCASSGSAPRAASQIGRPRSPGICHSWSADGRCVSLLKLLLSNACSYDCAYCVNRSSNDQPRATFSPSEVAEITLNFYRRNYIEGLFLSTGVLGGPDTTMERLLAAVRLLRRDHRFGGYIHLKILPGAAPELVAEAGRLADRVSVNIELPSARSLALLAPDKTRRAVLEPMGRIRDLAEEARREKGRAGRFAPAGQSTQLLVGASPEPDLEILRLSESLYRNHRLRRVYYSAFVPVAKDGRLPSLSEPPLRREHRLYQADWLLRFYGFSADEILEDGRPDLDLRLDPKAAWALRHPERFPLEVNQACYEELLRVPGIGVRSARRILRARRVGNLRGEDLKVLGVAMKRARHFLTAGGKHLGGREECGEALQPIHATRDVEPSPVSEQLPLFPSPGPSLPAALTGEF